LENKRCKGKKRKKLKHKLQKNKNKNKKNCINRKNMINIPSVKYKNNPKKYKR